MAEPWEVRVRDPAQITVTSDGADSSGPTDVTAFGTPVDVGNFGVTISFTDGGAQDGLLDENEQWTILATVGSPGSLTLGNKWTIAVTASTAGCVSTPEPDMVTFCLTCHDGTTPAGVTMSPNMINIADMYDGTNQHGNVAGNNGTNGFMKAPWQDVVTFGDGTWANAEIAEPYAALQCTFCHDGHGTDNIFHLRTSITIRGQVMAVGGAPGGEFTTDPFTTGIEYGFGDTTYKLPCFNAGGTQVSCTDPAAAQEGTDRKWGAFCTFCHDLASHNAVVEDTSCRTGHRHAGTAF
jgi:hypothetical protein